MEAAPAPRIGVVRRDLSQPVVAEAEARILQAELERRLGPVVLDLRVDAHGGGRATARASGPWLPIGHAAWPGTIDARVDLGRLGHESLAPLTALFARTVEPLAGEVRHRMLRHLGLLPREVVDDRLLDELGRATLRPTDVWLLVRGADIVSVADPAIAALGTPPDDPAIADLDTAFDAVVDDLAAVAEIERSLRWERSRVQAVAEMWRGRADDLVRRAVRSEREAAERCDAMAARIEVLQARLAAAEAAVRIAGEG